VTGWLVTRGVSVLAGLAGSYPLFLAVRSGLNGLGIVLAQLLVAGLVLGAYLLLAPRRGH
jgi:hypothetical protein